MTVPVVNTENLLAPSAAAKIMRLSKRRVQKLCSDGRIGLQIAGRYFIPREEAKRFKPKPPGRPKTA